MTRFWGLMEGGKPMEDGGGARWGGAWLNWKGKEGFTEELAMEFITEEEVVVELGPCHCSKFVPALLNLSNGSFSLS